MAEKPRVKAPKQRGTAPARAGVDKRWLAVAVAAAGVALGFAAVAFLIGFGGGGGRSDDVQGLRTTLESAGCTLQVVKALPGVHSITDPSGTSPTWNTDPPTSGPHYAVPAIFGRYEEELEPARVVHNLEHGGIFILYGNTVPDSTVEQLIGFYDDHKTGTIMAPLNRLGEKFALGAWVVDGDLDNAFLAKCTQFDEGAVSSFFDMLQFRGPERYDPTQLQPGM
jgi:uncharacterized protein DUF3105